MVERGVRFVTVNMFETVFNEITWDIHGSAPFSPIQCYKEQVGPSFDNAYASLLEDLHDRGLLKDTMVVAMGEFGRTPKVNPAGGRDHWPNAGQCYGLEAASKVETLWELRMKSERIRKIVQRIRRKLWRQFSKALNIDLETELARLARATDSCGGAWRECD